MTHATQLALMVVWLGVEGEQAKHAAWDAMSGDVEEEALEVIRITLKHWKSRGWL